MKRSNLMTIAFLVLPTMASASSLKLSLHPGEMSSGYTMAWTTFDGHLDNCLVDTGARVTVVKSHILSNASSLGRVPSGGLIGADQVNDLIQTNEIKSNDWTKKNLIIRRADKLPFNCILGNDFFLQESLSIDYTNQTLSTDSVFNGEIFPIKHYDGKWFGFDVEINGIVVESLFDTGAGLTLVDEELIKKYPENFEYLQKTEIGDATDSKAETSVYNMKSLKYGKWEKHNVTVIAYPFTQIHRFMPNLRIVIGHNIISKHRWHINNPKKEWSIH